MGWGGPRAALLGDRVTMGTAPGHCCHAGQRGSASPAARSCPGSSTKHGAAKELHLLQPLSPPYSRPALFLEPTSAPLLRDPFPSTEIRSGHSLQLQSLPAPPRLCSSTAAKIRSCSSNLQRGGRGGRGRVSGQAKEGVSCCRDPAFARGEIRQSHRVLTPRKAQSAA